MKFWNALSWNHVREAERIIRQLGCKIFLTRWMYDTLLPFSLLQFSK